ncbi:pregnancy-specific beta-1-glycoprotein 6-like isoform X2 [Anolis carolinensis]|uniref:pregnancy-specific beta-1-glycoprotein 6-like isoform X2 n=1 Tax=Anolis carolinensis TaxID=28377 RepID=UPI002F2B2F71
MPRTAWTPKGPCLRWWLMLLLGAHLLSSSCVAQPSRNITIKIKQKPPSVQVGDSVALIPEGSQRNLSSCRWFRGDRDRFFEIVEFMPFNNSVDYKEAYSGRESIDLYCELHIRNLSLWDSNFYRIEKITSNNTREADKHRYWSRGRLTPIATIGVAAACFVCLSFFIAIIAFQTANLTNSGDERLPGSPSTPGTNCPICSPLETARLG